MDVFDRIASSYNYPTPLSNSPSFLWLLLSLLSQKQSPDVSESFKNVYDYIVVGAGSAGSVVASRLSECPSASVLLLEAGGGQPVVFDVPVAVDAGVYGTDLDWNFTTVSQKNGVTGFQTKQRPCPCAKVVGGGSSINSMISVRGNHKNYDDWEALGATGWGYDDVLPYFMKLEDNMELGPSYYHGVGGPLTIMRNSYLPKIRLSFLQAARELGYPYVDANGKSQIGIWSTQYTERDGQRCSTAKAYLVPAEERDNLDIVINAFVTKILIRNNRAYGVQFDKNGTSHVVRARKDVIVSAGTINSPKLLMLSGIGPKKELFKFKIPVVKDLPVGQNLQDHVGFAYQPYIINEEFTELTDERYIQRYIRSKSGPLTMSGAGVLMTFLPNKGFNMGRSDYQLYLSKGSMNLFKNFGLKPEVYDQYYKPYENKTAFLCLSSLLHPKSRGYVALQSSNPYDPPIIDLNYFDHEDDVRDVARGMMTCNRIAKTRAMRRLGAKPLDTIFPGCENLIGNEFAYLECQARAIAINEYHIVGTNKMGRESDPSAVVDPQLRVIGVRGLRVVDASVMPLIPSGNTNIPTIMVAEKASDLIRQNQKCTTRFPVYQGRFSDPSSVETGISSETSIEWNSEDQWNK